ncbi:glutamyl aminopeptidase [Drosophila sulfurigaster albostrigata]|uniref:glutamyl aminopeptidase n=1 Tax=Drosophila sulfurigaster albostrigata TaxID=89887 RepID=UPI002D21E31C|nr:glutamyl aminopeptidase [Drosophila sulfurigaster albostrigata]
MLISENWLRAILFWAVAALAVINGVTADEEEIDYRLPTALAPTHYTLYLHPELDTGNFTGQELITIRVIEATKQIILHSNKLTITNVYVLNREVENYELDTVREFLIIDLAEELTVNAVITLGVLFEGQLLNKLTGLYSSSYQAPSGEQRNIATTQFEATYAREAFPCFDEPAMKATFQITVVHPTDAYDALSNMNKIETQYLGENTMATFGISVPMSTYLACIIVSDFESLSKTVQTNGIGNDFQLSAYATPHQLSKVQFALDFGAAVTEYYIQYFKVAYPLPKLDMAAIPDFASNAMENWGLLTYRETALLYDDDYSSTYNKQSIAAVLAHEITHQWFGNLVTMQWWNDLWLNEGFARFLQYKGVNAVYPDWGMLDQFQIIALHPVLVFDAKLSSHPIVQKAESPSEISALFDTISYEKAGSILRMLENLVGSEKFEEAVTNYLINFTYGNTVTDDFLTEVAAVVSDFDVKQLMRTWTEQMGYPVLNVTRTNAGFVITQQRFLSNKESYNEEAEASEFNYKWSVPVTYILDTFASGEVEDLIFQYDQDSVPITASSDVKWIKLNVHQTGYYRVNYDSILWEVINNQLIEDPSRFDIADRAHLLNDAFALADASQLAYSVPLEMTSYLAQEKDFVPWYVAASKLQSLQSSLMYTDSYVSYINYARYLLTNIYSEVGWTVDADDHLKNRLRVSVLTAACSLGVPDCLSQAAQRFTTWLNNPTAANRPAPDLREVVYYYGMQQSSSESNWEKLWEIFKAESDASEKLKLMYGLSGVQDPQLLYRFLDLGSDESIIRSQDYLTCIQNIAANPVGEPVVWEFYREQWPQLVERYGLNSRYLGRVIASITGRFESQVKLDEVEAFYNKYPESGAGAASRQQAIETIKYNINWLQENGASIANWLDGTANPLTVKNP